MKIKYVRNLATAALAASVLAVSGHIAQAASDIHFGPTGTEASISNPDGTWINMWGPAWVNTSFDTGNPPPSGDTQGSVYIQNSWSGTAGDSYNMVSPSTAWNAASFAGTDYTNLVFDFKYDTSSTITPGTAAHLEIAFDGGYSEKYITSINTSSIDPATSTSYFDGNWHHVEIPIPSSMSGVASVGGVSFYQWNPDGTTGTMNYWMANLALYARVVPVAPPTISAPVKSTASGLAVYFSTENSLYDRQYVLCTTNTGTSWMASGAAYPVSYSFNIADFPSDTNGCAAWMFLIPNPVAVDNAPDWNEPNAVVVAVQNTTNGANMTFQYKVNEDQQNSMLYGQGPDIRVVGGITNNYYYTAAPGSLPGGPITNVVSPTVNDITNESGNLGSITDPNGILGTWTVTFTSANDVTLTTPHGDTTNLVIPSYKVSGLAPGANGMDIYLGGQANHAASINGRIVYSDFAISGGAPTTFNDNFATDTVLNTNAWSFGLSSGKTILIVKPGWFFSWPLPDAGFQPQVSGSLTNTEWAEPATGYMTLYSKNAQMVSGSDIPAGNSLFFRLIKRTYTQLQVLWPGENNAPGTVSGKIGTPNPSAYNQGDVVTVTVNACDPSWHIVRTSGQTIYLYSNTDPNFEQPASAQLVNGSVQMSGVFHTASTTNTVTAGDLYNTNILQGTSSIITIN